MMYTSKLASLLLNTSTELTKLILEKVSFGPKRKIMNI